MSTKLTGITNSLTTDDILEVKVHGRSRSKCGCEGCWSVEVHFLVSYIKFLQHLIVSLSQYQGYFTFEICL